MGHKIVRKGLVLKFADGSDLDGCTITVRKTTIAELFRIRALSKLPGDEGFDELVEILAARLIEWDLEEEDGTPIPTTKEGLLSLEDEHFFAIISAWTAAAKGVDAPLPDASSDGERQTLEASIPMELPSSDLAS